MRDERRDLRRFLIELTPEQWAQDSLCAGWSVRDVVAHLTGWDNLLLYRSRRDHLGALLRFTKIYMRSFGSMDRLNHRIQAQVGDLETQELLLHFAADDGSELKWLFDGTNPAAHLAEYVIHHQDIRRALQRPRTIPSERLLAALDGITKLPGVRWKAWLSLRRRRWEATDVGWGRGHGRITSCPAEEILMGLAGRAIVAEGW